MLGHRELTMQEYAEILKRRYLLILICAALFLAAGIVISYICPRSICRRRWCLSSSRKFQRTM